MAGVTFSFDVLDKVSKPIEKMAKTFDKGNSFVEKFRKKLKVIPESLTDIEEEVDTVGKKTKKGFKPGPLKKFKNDVDETEDAVSDLNEKLGETGNFGGKIKKGFRGLAGIMGGIFAVDVLSGFGDKIKETVFEVEKSTLAIDNIFSNQTTAPKALTDINKFAKDSPFHIDKLTESWINLADNGFAPSMDQMTGISDLAAKNNKSFEEMTDILLDAQKGDFANLENLGITAEQSGDKVKFTYKGVQKEVDATSQSIRNYLFELAKSEDIQGASNRMLDKSAFKMVQLSNKWEGFYKNMSGLFAPIISQVVDILQTVVDKLQLTFTWVSQNSGVFLRFGQRILEATTFLFILRGAFISLSLIPTIISAIATAFAFLRSGTIMATLAQLTFNAIAAISPFGWIAIVIGLIAIMAAKFKWVGDIVSGLFATFKSSFSKIWNWLKLNIFEPLFNWFGSIAEFLGFEDIKLPNKFAPENVENFGINNNGLERKEETPSIYDSFNTDTPIADDKKTPIKDKMNTLAGKVQGNIKNIYITNEKLVEKIIFEQQPFALSETQLIQRIKEAIITSVNQVNFS